MTTGVIAVGMALAVVLSNHGATAPASKIAVETASPTTSVTAPKGHHTVTHHAVPKPGPTIGAGHATAPQGPVSPPPPKPAIHNVTTTTAAPTTTTAAPTTTTVVPVTSTTSPRRDGGDAVTPGVDN